MRKLIFAALLLTVSFANADPDPKQPDVIQESKNLLPDGPASSHSIEAVYRICQGYVYGTFAGDPFGITMANWVLSSYGYTWSQMAYAWGTHREECSRDVMSNLGNYFPPTIGY